MNESQLEISKRRAEREALDEKERALRLEKEVDKLKTRLERALHAGSPAI